MQWDVSQLSVEQLRSAIKKANEWPKGELLNIADMELLVVDQAAYLLFQMKWCWAADVEEQKTIDTIATGEQLQEEVDAFVLEYCRRLAALKTDEDRKARFKKGMTALIASQFFEVTGVVTGICFPTPRAICDAAQAFVKKHDTQNKDEVGEDQEEVEAQKIARTRCLCLSTLFFISGSMALTVSSSVILANQLASMSSALVASTALHKLPMAGLVIALGMMCVGIYLAVAWNQRPKHTFSELFCRKTSAAAVESECKETRV